jgi:hypothetical protein
MTQDIATPSKVVPLKPPSASELRTRLLAALPAILHYLLPALAFCAVGNSWSAMSRAIKATALLSR